MPRFSNFSICMSSLFVLTIIWCNFNTNQNSEEREIQNNFEWPEHWNAILKHSEILQLVLLDGTALKCIYKSGKERRKACNSLYSNPEARFGTMLSDFNQLYKVLDDTLIKPSNGQITVYDILPTSDPDTIVLLYTYFANIDKYIFITFRNKQLSHKNYHILRGSDITADIAIRKFLTISAEINGYKIILPENIKWYLTYAETQKFVECNFESSKNVNLSAPRIIPHSAVEAVTKFVDIFIENGQIPFLSFGTLLGWYRDCGIISHTHDIDFNVFATEYDPTIEKIFTNNPEFTLKHRIGKREHSIEYTFMLHHKIPGFNSTPVDIFYLYNYNETHEWSPFLSDFYQLIRGKSFTPKVKGLCTGDIYGFLFFIPCNFIEILKSNYGINWMNSDPYAGYFDEGQTNIEDGNWNLTKDEVVFLF
uniref:Uncharacterized protein n=1 Tax=Panagrolaimus sp. PS1159 TaxID=55785 RepID=A0AC35FD27_9BILA